MINWHLNKRLWRSNSHYDRYITITNRLSVLFSNKPYIASNFLNVANGLNDIMQEYESTYCAMEDPMFYFAFSISNALFLQVGKKFDEMGARRIGYIVNGYKEGLTKHLLYPSYTLPILKSIIETYFQFANDSDKSWLDNNKYKFVPFELEEN